MLQSQKCEYLCWRSCLRASSLAFNTCRVNRLIFTKWAEFKCHRGGIQIAVYRSRLQFSCRGHSVSHFTNYLIGPTFQCVAETEFIKANAAEKDDVPAWLKFTTPLQPMQSRQVLATMTNVAKVAFFNYHNGARVIKWISVHEFWSNRGSPAKYST